MVQKPQGGTVNNGSWGGGGHLAVRSRTKNRVLSIKVDKIDRLRENEGKRFGHDGRKFPADEQVRVVHASKGDQIRFPFVICTDGEHVNA